MPALSLNQIAQITAKNLYEFPIYFSPEDYKTAINAVGGVTLTFLKKHKFEYNITDHLSNNKKGIYIFALEEIPLSTIDFRYLLYIGKVAKNNNFKNRFYTYRNSIGDGSAAENIMYLTNLWPDNTYVYFYEIKSDQEIADLEKILINKLRPAFNEEYFTSKSISSTSLYKITNP